MKKYYLIDDKAFETEEDATNYIIENSTELDEAYNEWLDCDGEIEVAGIKFYPSTILKECDPIAYDCGYDDFTDSIYYDIIDELETMDDGETTTIYGIEVEAHEYLFEED